MWRYRHTLFFSGVIFFLTFPFGGLAAAVTVIAHRGDSGHFPENTLAAFESAIRKKSDLVELDSHLTKDGVPAVIHDSTLDKTTNADEIAGVTDIKVADKTWEEIKALDAGGWKSPAF
jgi:glycerophosphoryl diester phosphodiesterase